MKIILLCTFSYLSLYSISAESNGMKCLDALKETLPVIQKTTDQRVACLFLPENNLSLEQIELKALLNFSNLGSTFHDQSLFMLGLFYRDQINQKVKALWSIKLSAGFNSPEGNLFYTYMHFLKDRYRDAFGLSTKQLDKVFRDSLSLLERSILFLQYKQDIHTYIESGKQSIKSFALGDINRDNIEGGAIGVFSSSKNDKLPVELWSGHTLKRKAGELVIELGRFATDSTKSTKQLGTYLLATMGALLNAYPQLSKIIIKPAGIAQERYFRSLGFEIIEDNQFISLLTKKEKLMQIKPDVFRALSIKKLLWNNNIEKE